MHTLYEIDCVRQQFLDRIHRYLQGRADTNSFRTGFGQQWAEERDSLWRTVWHHTQAQRCEEREQVAGGNAPRAKPTDPRRLPRMLDRISALKFKAKEEEKFREAVKQLLDAYRNPGATTAEVRFIDYPQRVHVFERPLPPGGSHRYPCTVPDIRRQLALVPEYDLEGLWAIGMEPPTSDYRRTYGVYYRRKLPMRKPVIVLFARDSSMEFRMRRRYNVGFIKHRYRVERGYGMEVYRVGSQTFCHWPNENGQRFTVEHVLLHEIGHHVLYQQRWRNGHSRRLPSRNHEQFAEDYAIRFNRERKMQERRQRR